MKKSRGIKKLNLRKITISKLTENQMAKIMGAATADIECDPGKTKKNEDGDNPFC
ncbi:class I lanthipeptide [Aquimarina longa]|uniref:class I lanthipeptide n=1 Tax=Aquimarina longa TaxID=1080221 RepID=UPI000A89DBCF|nr:class I lanthipeptide [Aquimarina longa]